MRGLALGVLAAVVLSAPALASEYIVVNSTDPGVKVGQALSGGTRISIGVGRTLTLMRPSGEIVRIQGGSNGVVLPSSSGPAADGARFAAVQSLFSPPPSGRTFGARRGFCPGPEALDTISAIVRSNQAGCRIEARKALQIYLKARGVDPVEVDHLYDPATLTETAPGAPTP